MSSESDQTVKIYLEGDWSMKGVTDQFQQLTHWATRFATTAGKSLTPRLDLAGITEFDACGCQLLTLFVLYLQKQGITPVCNCMPITISHKARLLGFDQHLDYLSSSPKECL